jgi:hypothetical protein
MLAALLVAFAAGSSAPAGPDLLRDLSAASARNLLFLPVRLGGAAERPFVLDTGASLTIVDSGIAAEEGLRAGPAVVTRGAGADRCPLARLETAKARAGRTSLAPVFAADLGGLASFLGMPIAGIAGGSLFSKAVVALDFARGEARLLPPGSFQPAPRDRVVPLLDPRGTCCLAEVILRFRSKTLRGRFLVDSGAPGFEVILAAPFARNSGLLPADSSGKIEVPGLCATSSLVPLPGKAALRLGDVAVSRVNLFASLDAQGALASSDFDGVIGGALLRRLGEVLVDAPHRRLVIRTGR